jgi:drug/metabolite transporter (DMT)-like permease
LAPKGSLWVGNGIQNLSGGLAVAPFAFMLSDVSDIVWSGRLFASLVWLIVLGSIAAFFLWFYLLNVFEATAASAYHFLMPPLGMLFGWIVLGEHVADRDLFGILPVALGIYLVTRPARSSVLRAN